MVLTSLLLVLTLLQGAPQVNQLARQALQDIRAGKYVEAREILQRALRYAPQDPRLWSYLGDADSQLQEVDAAISAFQKVVSLTPRDSQPYFNLGVLYLRQGATRRALEKYREGLALSPDNVTANQNYAFLLMKVGKYREAVPPLRKLEKMDGSELTVRVALIESLLKCGMAEAGQRELSEFITSPFATPSDQLKLANVLIEDHLLTSAQSVLERLVQRSPDLAEAHARLGWLLLGRKNYNGAARQSGLAVRLAPASAGYSMQLADVLLKWKNYPTALAFLQAVKSRFGSLPEYQYKLAWAHYGLRQVPEAAAVLEHLVHQHPELDLPHYSLGNCYLASSRLNEAERQYRAAIRLNPNKASYYAALGQALRKEGGVRIGEAVVELKKGLALDPGDTASQLQLALCYEQQASLGKAQQLLEAAVRRQPALVAAHRVLARVYYREGKRQQGNQQATIVAKLDAEQLRSRARLLDSSTPDFQ